jgi:hypothetical protein
MRKRTRTRERTQRRLRRRRTTTTTTTSERKTTTMTTSTTTTRRAIYGSLESRYRVERPMVAVYRLIGLCLSTVEMVSKSVYSTTCTKSVRVARSLKRVKSKG